MIYPIVIGDIVVIVSNSSSFGYGDSEIAGDFHSVPGEGRVATSTSRGGAQQGKLRVRMQDVNSGFIVSEKFHRPWMTRWFVHFWIVSWVGHWSFLSGAPISRNVCARKPSSESSSAALSPRNIHHSWNGELPDFGMVKYNNPNNG